MKNTKLLVVVDESRATKRALEYVAQVASTEQRALDRANAVLRRGGLAAGAIEAHYCNLVDASRATQEILRLARSRKCGTVVIGKKSLSWLGELIHGDPAEELVRQGKGFTIWVVE